MRSVPLRLADGVIAAVCVAAALLLFGLLNSGGEAGKQVVVETPGQPAMTYLLDQPRTLTVTGRDGLSLTIEIADGCVRVTGSDCPDHVCEHSGALSRGGQSAVCVPAGVTVRVIGGNDAVDGVTA